MKKMERRAILCILLAGVLVLGLCIYVYKYIADGETWATFHANRHIYDNGRLSKGEVYDINGDLLVKNTKGSMNFSDSYSTRRAMVHITGDTRGNIATSVNKFLADEMIGYNFISGAYSFSGNGRKVYLSLDSKICNTANEALDGRRGTVGVYNYKTGEIICMVSSPNYDPEDPPKLSKDDTSGTYINRFFSATMAPGSIFKLVTTAAAIENIDNVNDWSYTCDGEIDYDHGDTVTCPYAHGKESLKEALADSCNCAFAKLTEEIGGRTMEKYVEDLGLTKSLDIEGLHTAAGSFEFPRKKSVNLAWAGIGQYKDMVNPCTFMRYMGAIANGGKGVNPKLIHSVKFMSGFPAKFSITTSSERLLSEDTASKLGKMMKNNVKETYGEDNFPGLKIYAKSGTAEVVKSDQPNAWFAGYIKNKSNPYAFVVFVEKGGRGSEAAGSVANKVLQAIVD